jgi:hypothetical protein
MLYSTKSLTRDGLTYTAEFRDLGSEQGYHAVVAFRVEAAGQVIDAFRDAPKGWTEEALDGWFVGKFPQLSMLADEVYEQGTEVHAHVEHREAA